MSGLHNHDKRFDVVKGFAIILMVLAHASCWTPLQNFINLFHMPVFFICAGWFYKCRSDDFKDVCFYVWKRIKRLWWPFVFWGGLCVAMWNLCFKINIYSDNPSLGGSWAFATIDISTLPRRLMNVLMMRDGASGMTGTFWFLRSMFFALSGYRIVDYVISKTRFSRSIVQSFIAFALLVMCSWFLPRGVAWGVQWIGGKPTMIAYALIHVGVLLHGFNLDLLRIQVRWRVVVGALALIVLIGLLPIEDISVSKARYNYLITMLIAAVCGWYGLFSLSNFVPWTDVWAYVGAHTMPIMILHFLSFKLISLGGVLMLGEELFKVGAFPVLYEGFAWCLAYTIVGIVVPLLLNTLWWKCYDFLKQRMCYA